MLFSTPASTMKFKIVSLLAAITVLAVDFFTGRAVQFPVTYVIPVCIAAWWDQKITAYAIAVFMPFARVIFHFLWDEAGIYPVAILNAFINVSALVFYVYLIDRITLQKKALERKVRVLEGILPVCAACKRIRTDKGEYEQIEQYITEHSEASFTHSICPDCAKKLYPDFYKEKQG